ncbi:hypothetical protein FACS1894201_08310 [Bacteroidia bacterium]|nr:hypothetical protein FACS1894201_08310 [Bacteroidia bacterium]
MAASQLLAEPLLSERLPQYSVWQLFTQSAKLADERDILFGIGVENRFVKNLNDATLAAVLPHRSGTWLVNYTYDGYSAYRRHQAAIGLAKRFTPYCSYALRTSFIAERYVNERTKRGYLQLHHSCVITLSKQVDVLTTFSHYIRLSYNQREDPPLSHLVTLEMDYHPTRQLRFCLQMQNESFYKPILRLKAGYTILKNLTLLGAMQHDGRLGVGFIFKTPPISYTFQTEYTAIIGNITSLSVDWRINP